MRPGTASFLPLSAGIQKLWMTSRLSMSRYTGTPTGMTISEAVSMSVCVLVGCLEAGLVDVVVGVDAVAVEVVVVAPPPLLADDPHVDGVVGLVGEVEDGGDGGDGEADEDDGGQGGPADLGLGVAVELGGDLVAVVVLALAELPDHEQHADLDEHEHDAGDEERDVRQVVDLVGGRALGLERGLRRVRGAGRQGETGERDQADEAGPRAQAREAGHQLLSSSDGGAFVVGGRLAVPTGLALPRRTRRRGSRRRGARSRARPARRRRCRGRW